MRLSPDQARDGSLEAHVRPAAGLALHLQYSAELESPLAHRLLPHPAPRTLLGVEPAAVARSSRSIAAHNRAMFSSAT